MKNTKIITMLTAAMIALNCTSAYCHKKHKHHHHHDGELVSGVNNYKASHDDKAKAQDFKHTLRAVKDQLDYNEYSERLYIVKNHDEYYRLMIVNNPHRTPIKKEGVTLTFPVIIATDTVFPANWMKQLKQVCEERNIKCHISQGGVFGNNTLIDMFGS